MRSEAEYTGLQRRDVHDERPAGHNQAPERGTAGHGDPRDLQRCNEGDGKAASRQEDEWAMGVCHPKRRAHTTEYKKRRRNNRILEKFYDAKYTDTRKRDKNGKLKTAKGAELPCGRTRPCEPRHGKQNLRPYRGRKVSQGKRTTWRQRYPMQANDIVTCRRRKNKYQVEKHVLKGVHNNRTGARRVEFEGGSTADASVVRVVRHACRWIREN